MKNLNFKDSYIVLYKNSPTSTSNSTQKAQMLTQRNVFLYTHEKLSALLLLQKTESQSFCYKIQLQYIMNAFTDSILYKYASQRAFVKRIKYKLCIRLLQVIKNIRQAATASTSGNCESYSGESFERIRQKTNSNR